MNGDNDKTAGKNMETVAVAELRRRMNDLCDHLKEGRIGDFLSLERVYMEDTPQLLAALSDAERERVRAIDRELLLEAARDKNCRKTWLNFLLSEAYSWRGLCRPLDDEDATRVFTEAARHGNVPAVKTLLECPEIASRIELNLEPGGIVHSLARGLDLAGRLQTLEYLVRESPLRGRFASGFFPALLEAHRAGKSRKGQDRLDAESWRDLIGRFEVTGWTRESALKTPPPEKSCAVPTVAAEETGATPADAGAKPARPKRRAAKKEKPFELAGRRELSRRLNEEVVDPMRHPEAYAPFGIEAPPSLLFYGEPGCGKTYAVDRLVEFLDMKPTRITASDVYCSEAHQSNIRKRFLQAFLAAERGERAVVIMDELDSFLVRRDNAGKNPWVVEEVNEFLTCLQEAHDRGVLVIGMCNSLARLDPAALRPGRFDHLIEVEMPTREEVGALFESELDGKPVCDELNLNPVLDALAGKSMADAACVLETALRLAGLRRKELLDQDCLDGALKAYRGRRRHAALALGRRRPPKLEKARGKGDAPFSLPGRRELCRRLNEEVVEPARHPGRYARFGLKTTPSLLIHGEPGCGKTFAVERLVDHLGWPCVRIESSDVYSEKAHESFIRERFEEAFVEAEDSGRAVVIMDELDSFLSNRDNAGKASWKVEEVNEFLTCLQQAHDRGVLVIGMCNEPERLDPAALRPGRFDLHIEVEPPTREEARELLEAGLAPYSLPGLDLNPMLDALSGKSVADVTQMAERARRFAADADKEYLDQDCLDAALDDRKRTRREARKYLGPIGF